MVPDNCTDRLQSVDFSVISYVYRTAKQLLLEQFKAYYIYVIHMILEVLKAHEHYMNQVNHLYTAL